AALHNFEIQPSLLDLGARGSCPDTLYGGDGAVPDRTHGQQTRAGGLTVHMDGAGPALPYAASELGSRQPNDIAQHPQEWHVLRGIDAAVLTVDAQGNHEMMIGSRDLNSLVRYCGCL